MTITAKFATVCPCCNNRINAGDKVEWAKGSKARHAACAASNALPAASPSGTRITMAALSAHVATLPRSRGYSRRTGCSCGSREDSSGDLIPSDRNCASCEHDA
jgi:hypothetical protein